MNDPTRNPFQSPHSARGDQRGGRSMSLVSFARTGQIITFALAQGLLFMGASFGYLSLGNNNPPPAGMPAGGGDLVLPGIGLLIAFGACGAAFVLPPMIRRTGAAKFRASGEDVELPVNADLSMKPATTALIGAAQSATLVGQAVLEGAATINLILMFVGGHHVVHLSVVAVCLIGIVLQTPTVGKFEETIENALNR